VYNLLTRDVEYELLPCCAAEGVGVTVFKPAGRRVPHRQIRPQSAPAGDNRFGRERTGKGTGTILVAGNFKAVAELKKNRGRPRPQPGTILPGLDYQ